MRVLERLQSELVSDKFAPREQHNVNTSNCKALMPYRLEGGVVEVSPVFWNDLLSQRMRDELTELLQKGLLPSLHTKGTASDTPADPPLTEDDFSLDNFLGLGDAVASPPLEGAPAALASQSNVHQSLSVAVVVAFPIANDYNRTASKTQLALYSDIYEWYISWYDYEVWAPGLTFADLGMAHGTADDTVMASIYDAGPSDASALIKLARTRVLTGKALRDDDLQRVLAEDFSPGLLQFLGERVRLHIGQGCAGVFAKMSGKSAKNDVKLAPLRSVGEVIENLTKSKDILCWLGGAGEKDSSFIILPWNSEITEENEYRVFVKNGVPTAISQQRWYRVLEHPADRGAIVAATKALCADLFPRLPFPSATLDVWFRTCDGGVCTAHLIECNPWGGFFSSGASLFDWEQHYAEMHDESEVTFATVRKG
ncbi:hypothetical protein DIPPA_17734 [Diplonema papillatum]|nr:hypothetical protein DIPPA_17734 [Diplonema papillatum]